MCTCLHKKNATRELGYTTLESIFSEIVVAFFLTSGCVGAWTFPALECVCIFYLYVWDLRWLQLYQWWFQLCGVFLGGCFMLCCCSHLYQWFEMNAHNVKHTVKNLFKTQLCSLHKWQRMFVKLIKFTNLVTFNQIETWHQLKRNSLNVSTLSYKTFSSVLPGIITFDCAQNNQVFFLYWTCLIPKYYSIGICLKHVFKGEGCAKIQMGCQPHTVFS